MEREMDSERERERERERDREREKERESLPTRLDIHGLRKDESKATWASKR